MNKLKTSVLSLSLLTVMSGAAVAPALGTISNHFSSAPSLLIKLIITLPALMIILTSSLFSLLITYLSPKKITIIGLVLYLFGGCFAGFMNSIYLVLFFRILLGIGVGLIMPLSTGFISILFDEEEQSQLMGYSSAMNNLGGIIATSLSGVLVSLNWRFSFLIYLLGAIVLVLILLYLPNVTFDEDTSKEKANNSSPKLTRKDFFVVLPYALTMFLIMVCFYALPSNFSMILTKTALVPVSAIGFLMSVQNITAFITGIFFGRIILITKKGTVYIAALTLMIGFVLESFIKSMPFTIVGLVFVGLGLGLLTPILFSQIARHVDRKKSASAMSIMSVFLFLGQFTSPIILDSILSTAHINLLQGPYYLAAILALILFAVLFFIPIKIGK